MYYLLLYDVVDNYVERRQPLRELHLESAKKALARGELVLGGAFADPVDGAALVFKGEDPSVAERFARDRPLRGERTRLELEGAGVERGRRGRSAMIARSWTAEATPVRARGIHPSFPAESASGNREHRGTPRGLRSEREAWEKVSKSSSSLFGSPWTPSGSSPATTPTSRWSHRGTGHPHAVRRAGSALRSGLEELALPLQPELY